MNSTVLPLAELAPAKLNLALHITGRRPDGFHSIESLVVFTRFGDRLSVEEADSDTFTVVGRYAADVPTDGSNLVLKARDALRTALPHASARVSIMLEKNLPVASGIGGGSSDAAATLRALAKLWDIDGGHDRLIDIGRTLGADLPMCLAARPLIAKGIGDEIEPVSGCLPLGLVLVNPGVAVSTPEVFAALTKRDNDGLPPLPGRIDFHSLRDWLEATRNDLEDAATALQPAISHVRAALMRADAGFARMSGSGATCFGLFETGNVAKRAAQAIRAKHPDWFVAATRSMGEDVDE